MTYAYHSAIPFQPFPNPSSFPTPFSPIVQPNSQFRSLGRRDLLDALMHNGRRRFKTRRHGQPGNRKYHQRFTFGFNNPRNCHLRHNCGAQCHFEPKMLHKKTAFVHKVSSHAGVPPTGNTPNPAVSTLPTGTSKDPIQPGIPFSRSSNVLGDGSKTTSTMDPKENHPPSGEPIEVHSRMEKLQLGTFS